MTTFVAVMCILSGLVGLAFIAYSTVLRRRNEVQQQTIQTLGEVSNAANVELTALRTQKTFLEAVRTKHLEEIRDANQRALDNAGKLEQAEKDLILAKENNTSLAEQLTLTVKKANELQSANQTLSAVNVINTGRLNDFEKLAHTLDLVTANRDHLQRKIAAMTGRRDKAGRFVAKKRGKAKT